MKRETPVASGLHHQREREARVVRFVARHQAESRLACCMPARGADAEVRTPPESAKSAGERIGLTATACGTRNALFAALQQRYTRGRHFSCTGASWISDAVTDATRFWATRP
jgi:hypothetical protein